MTIEPKPRMEFNQGRTHEKKAQKENELPFGDKQLFDRLYAMNQKLKNREDLTPDIQFGREQPRAKVIHGGSLPEHRGRDNSGMYADIRPLDDWQQVEDYDHWNVRERTEVLNEHMRMMASKMAKQLGVERFDPFGTSVGQTVKVIG